MIYANFRTENVAKLLPKYSKKRENPGKFVTNESAQWLTHNVGKIGKFFYILL